MTTTLSRLQAAGVWGCTPESYRASFLPSLKGRLIFNVADAPENMGPFWLCAHADYPIAHAWGKHPEEYPNNDEGVSGLTIQAHALDIIHGRDTNIAPLQRWITFLARTEIVVPIPSIPEVREQGEMRGGWPEWFNDVRPELSAIAHTLKTCRAYNDYQWLELVIGLSLAIAVFEKVGDDGYAAQAKALIHNACITALWDAERNDGLGLYHDPRTGIIMPGRDHEPNQVSTDATAGLVYGLLVAFAATGNPHFLTSARVWRDDLRRMGTAATDFQCFVERSPIDSSRWRGCGYTYDHKIVPASRAIWPIVPSPPGGHNPYQIGIPPSSQVSNVLARYDEGLKGLVKP